LYPYSGVKEVTLSDEDLALFYEDKLKFDLQENQYLVISHRDKMVERLKYADGKIKKVKQKPTISNKMLGTLRPRNLRQELYFDLLESNTPLTMVSSMAGCGKTFLATAYALQELEKGTYNKILFLRNNVPIEGIDNIGYLPGDIGDKLKGYFAYIADILTREMFDFLIAQNKIEIGWLGDMRGRSISDSIVICSESQNLSTSLAKMLISRMGDGTRLIFDFDFDQIDKKEFKKDNGMVSIINSLTGNPLVGMIELLEVERSPLAELASLIK